MCIRYCLFVAKFILNPALLGVGFAIGTLGLKVDEFEWNWMELKWN